MLDRGGAAGLLFAVAVALAPPAAPGQEPSAPSPAAAEGEELASLLALLDQETAVATKSRMNSDYVPGIVTVLDAEEMLALGFRTVWEALVLVPGIHALRDPNGSPTLMVRGLDFPFNSGNMKILIDSVPLSRDNVGINGAVLDLPLAMVERIEVIRGPGSVVYGDFAFMGLVNVVTRRAGSAAWLRGESEESWAAGGRLVLASGARPVEFTLQLEHTASDDAPYPEPLRADADRTAALAALGAGPFSLTAALVDRTVEEAPSARRRGGTVFDERSWSIALADERELAHDLRSAAHLRGQGNRLAIAELDFDGDLAELGWDLTWSGLDRHAVLFGISYATSEIDSARSAPPPPPGLPPPPELLVQGVDREVFGVTLQDQIDLGARTTLTAGVRYDDHSDVGERWTPRLAAVFRIGSRHLLKAQYSEGFRAPTFFELYSPLGARNEALDFEVNETSELGYVYRDPRRVVRATLFRTALRDMIFRAAPAPGGSLPGFGNLLEARAEGLELEWEERLGEKFKLGGNLSFVDTEDQRNPQQVARENLVAADTLGNLWLLFEPARRAAVSARWNHVGDRNAGGAEAAGYDLVGLTATVRELLGTRLELRAAIDNLLDEEIRYLFNGFGALAVFASEFPGRTVHVELVWRPGP
jgi:iron complex outermembrane receptor protein